MKPGWVVPVVARARCSRAAASAADAATSPAVRLRRAERDDVATLQAWDRCPHVAAVGGADCDMDWVREVPRAVPWRDILIAQRGARRIGVVVIIDPAREETDYWAMAGRPGVRAIDIWIGEEDCIGKGFGTQMMAQALQRCFAEDDVQSVLVDPLISNVRAHRFYQKMGFRPIERRVFGPDDCIVHAIDRDAFEAVSAGKNEG